MSWGKVGGKAINIQPTQNLDNKRLKAKCSKNMFGNSLTSSSCCCIYHPGIQPWISCRRRVMCHFHAMPSTTSTETPIWRSDWDRPQHRQKYENISLSPAQPCQEHWERGWIDKTAEISARLGSTKTHPNTNKQLWVMICFGRTALLLQTENKTSWNGCAVISM